jgi:hypothetical protein
VRTGAERVEDLIDGAERQKARAARFSLQHGYYAGVETAARQVLHPEIDALRNVGWLDRHNPGFMSGYVRTAARLASRWAVLLAEPASDTTGHVPSASPPPRHSP